MLLLFIFLLTRFNFLSVLLSLFNFMQATAYYYHGLILDEGNTEKSHGMAIAALQAADEYLKESKKACEAFNTAPPQSRLFFLQHHSFFPYSVAHPFCLAISM